MAGPQSAGADATDAAAPSTLSETSPSKNQRQSPAPFQLDLEKLSSLLPEQQLLQVLTFSVDLLRRVDALDEETATEEQGNVKKALVQIVDLAQPVPTRAIRNNVARSFAGILTKGNRRVLYESINELVAIINAPAKDKEAATKHAATTCLGSIFAAAGDSAISLSPLACGALLKLAKSVSRETGLRGAIFKAVRCIIRGITVALDEDVARSIWKQLRNALTSDKSSYVLLQACVCLETLVLCTPYFDNSNDFEKLQTALQQGLDSNCPSVRHAAASCLAAELVKTYSDVPSRDAVFRSRKTKKSKKPPNPQDMTDEELERASSPAPEKPATALNHTLSELLKVLSTHYCRASPSNRVRAGIAVAYVQVFRRLGEGVLEEKYDEIARHLFSEILSNPAWNYTNKYRLQISRKFVRVILEKVVGQMLGETAQLHACGWLMNEVIKDYPQTIKERPEPGKLVLVGAISALTRLIQSLDVAVASMSESVREGLLQVLQHPSYSVQIHAAKALRAFVLACPQQLLLAASICTNSLHRELGLLSSQRYTPRKCLGYVHGLAAVLSTASQRPLDGSVDVYAGVLQQATNLLKSSGSSDLRVSSCQLQIAWTMIGGLMSLGPSFVKIHLPPADAVVEECIAKTSGKGPHVQAEHA